MTYGRGIFWVSASYIFWGFSPFYWKLLGHVPASELMVHRVIWSFVALLPLLLRQQDRTELKRILHDKKSLGLLALTSFLIIYNWYNFVLAMITGRVLQSSLAYFLNPLITVALGLFLLKEHLNKPQRVSIALATLGVAILIVKTGEIPTLALILAFSFAFYGYFKKKMKVSGALSLLIETGMGTPFVLIPLILYGKWDHSLGTWALLVLAGPVTALPLIWYAWGVQRLPLATAGFLQFTTPIIQFLLAVFCYGEPFNDAKRISFGIIWVALAIFCVDIARRLPRKQR